MGEISGHAVVSGADLSIVMRDGRGTGTMDHARYIADWHSAFQHEINQEVASITGAISAGWTGDASEGSQAATQPLKDGARQSAEALERARQVHSGQGGQFVHVRDSMEKVPANPPETDVHNSMTPWDANTEAANIV